MAITISCPECGKTGKVSDHLAGTTFCCQECNRTFLVSISSSGPRAEAVAGFLASAAEDEALRSALASQQLVSTILDAATVTGPMPAVESPYLAGYESAPALRGLVALAPDDEPTPAMPQPVATLAPTAGDAYALVPEPPPPPPPWRWWLIQTDKLVIDWVRLAYCVCFAALTTLVVWRVIAFISSVLAT
jgi:hypothetical protein